MEDKRNDLIKEIEDVLLKSIDASQAKMIADDIVCVLGNYEISDRCTDIIVADDKNMRILKRFIACLSLDGKSNMTIYQYNRSVNKMFEFIGKEVQDIGVYDIRYYLACEKQRGLSDRFIENIRANLSAFFQWLVQEEIISKNPCLNVKPIKYKKEIRLPFNSVEIDALRSACKNPKERSLIEFLLSTGIRVSELSNMKIQDVDFNKLSVHVTHGKGNKERIVYMNDVAKYHLNHYIVSRKDSIDALFCNNSYSPILPNGIRYILNQLGKRGDVINVHPHRFRRTFASSLANRGMKIEEIKMLMGHSNINTTMEYIYTSDNSVSNSYKRYAV